MARLNSLVKKSRTERDFGKGRQQGLKARRHSAYFIGPTKVVPSLQSPSIRVFSKL
jgi:hypothetical protein